MMNTSVIAVCVALLALPALAESNGNGISAATLVQEKSLEDQWSQELDAPESEGKGSIQRVVGLLEQMKSKLVKEADAEAVAYDKKICWCETNEKLKTKAIADGQSKTDELMKEVESRGARRGVLGAKIDIAKKSIAETQEAMVKAEKMRESENADFLKAEQETNHTINNLKNAVTLLNKQHTGSFLQLSAPAQSSVKDVLRDISLKYDMMMAGKSSYASGEGTALLQSGHKEIKSQSLTASLLSQLGTSANEAETLPLNFAEEELAQQVRRQARSTHVGFLQTDAKQPMASSYSSQSGSINGILNTMLEDFENDLSTSQRDEEKSAEDHEAMSSAQKAQLDASTKNLDEMQSEHAENKQALADAKEDLELTRGQVNSDIEFLHNMKLECHKFDVASQDERKTRQAETQAVSETISILTNDDSKDLLEKTVSFLEEKSDLDESTSTQARRQAAAATLREAAQAPNFDADDLLEAWHAGTSDTTNSRVTHIGGPRTQLSALAVSVKFDGFKKVLEMMDMMVNELKTQQSEEVKFKDSCTSRFNKNEHATVGSTEAIKDLEVKQEQLEATIQNLEDEISSAQSEVKNTEVAIKKASETREKENSEYQMVIADQRATQEVLAKAQERMKEFYDTKSSDDPSYKKSGNASPVLYLLQSIAKDSKKSEADAVQAEEDAQNDYESFVTDSKKLIAQLSAAVTSRTKAIAANKLDLAEATDDHDSTKDELALQQNLLTGLHEECDFIMRNFAKRQAARAEEVEAISRSKQMLLGSNDAYQAPTEAPAEAEA